MKKVLLFMFLVIMLTGCSLIGKKDEISSVTDMLDGIKSYQLEGKMTIYRSDNEIKSDVYVDYLEPSYYKVTFKSNGGNEQIILKNDDGIFILSPEIKKQYELKSEWPKAQANAYLIDRLWSDIKADKDMKYEKNDDEICFEAKLDNPKANKAKMTYSIAKSAPTKVELLCDDELKVLVEINKASINPRLSKELFNKEAIMKASSVIDSAKDEIELNISVGYLLEDTSLKTKKATEDCVIMCYGGAKNYTIVAKRIELMEDNIIPTVSDYDIIKAGIMVYSKEASRCFINDLEIIVYSDNLAIEEARAIIDEIGIESNN